MKDELYVPDYLSIISTINISEMKRTIYVPHHVFATFVDSEYPRTFVIYVKLYEHTHLIHSCTKLKMILLGAFVSVNS